MSRSYCGLYVDAGYLEHAAATRLTGSSYRGGITVTYEQLIEGLAAQITEHAGLPLLRVHWYDGAADRGNVASPTQKRIELLPHVKVRLGRRTNEGLQKGVDVRIGLDLATHSRMSNVDVVYLLSGDDDLTEAVEEAQGHGAQVNVLAVPGAGDRPHGLAEHLARAADEVVLVATDLLDQCVQRATRPTPAAIPAPQPAAGKPAASAPRPQAPGVGVPTPATVADAANGNTQPVVYSSTTGGRSVIAHHLASEPISDEAMRSVCRNVVKSWKSSATQADLVELRASKPSIPSELDRALLLDMSDTSGQYELDLATRHRLRGMFWDVIDD